MKPARWALLAVAAGLPTLQISCSGTWPGARRLQTSDGLAGGANFTRVAARSTVVAAIRQPLTTVKLGLAVLWNRPREVVAGNSPVHPGGSAALPESPGSDGFEAALDRLNFPRAEMGELAWFIDGQKFFPELDRQIANASQSIKIQVYIFDNDDIAVRCADALKRRSSDIRVEVLYDDFGSTLAQHCAPQTLAPEGFIPPGDMGSYLRAKSKVKARRTLNPWLIGDHTKLLVFDHQTAFLGGMNIGREYDSEWHDLMVRVEGPIVQSLEMEFNRAWRKAGPFGGLHFFERPAPAFSSKPAAGEIPLRLLRTDPVSGRYEILGAALLAIRGAHKRVWIETPYLAHDGIAMAVGEAARRGVDVRVIIPLGKVPNLMDAGNLATAGPLIEAGAKVYRYSKMTHLKVMICDDWAMVGSANLDALSLRINRELNLAFSDPATIQVLETSVFRADLRKSTRLTFKETEGLANALAEALADQL